MWLLLIKEAVFWGTFFAAYYIMDNEKVFLGVMVFVFGLRVYDTLQRMDRGR